MNKIIIITQVRTGSTRFPNKVLKKSILGKTLIDHHIDRIRKSKYSNNIIIATTTNQCDDIIVRKFKSTDINIYRGSEENVLERFYGAAKQASANTIVRLTSDCPLIDPELMDKVITKHLDTFSDYTSNSHNETFPDGQDVEVMSYHALEYAYRNAKKIYQQEHVTPYIKENPNIFKITHFDSEVNYRDVRMTVDTMSDLDVINVLLKNVGESSSWVDYKNYYINQNLQNLNGNQIRNEGFLKSIKDEKK
jgi:spore coat polysaccharide biosynthesis protein SpsF (cytidylyltransferase family)